MAQDKKETYKKLSALWRSNDVTVLATRGKKYAIISDIHLGDGGGADDFYHNERTLKTALTHYNKHGYNLILLGDIEEFWQFDLEKIVNRYKDTVYKAIKAFGDNRVYRIFGNHDLEWCPLADPIKNIPVKYGSATEALKMKDKGGNIRILLVHGHQGDKESDKHAWRSRFFVRLYKKVEPYFKIDRHTSATKSQITKDYERILYSWAKKSKVILVCGHSHRTIFASKSYVDLLREEIAELEAEINANPTNTKLVKRNRKKLEQLHQEHLEEKRKKRDIDPTEPRGKPRPCYFNTGCALYTDGITAVEIADGEMKLVKWHRDTTRRPRFEIYGRGKLSAFVGQVTK